MADTVVFFHPDLGIGGAERLVVDAAVGLQTLGHKVVIFTNHCDRSHCFDECRDGKTASLLSSLRSTNVLGTLDVRVRGDWLVPPSFLSRLTILCAILRHIHLVLAIHYSGELAKLRPAAYVVDQLSAGLPLLKYLTSRTPILFYCHFPDLLLARGRESLVKRAYRVPFDAVEQWSMGFADAVAVNSNFTRGIVAKTWPSLDVDTKVVYPCVDTAIPASEAALPGDKKTILSINRFERKKDIALAIKAFAKIPTNGVRLVLAGGYDARVIENVQYHTELQALATSLNLRHHTVTPSKLASPASTLADVPADTQVLFLLSVPGPVKDALLRTASLLVYTPSNEHFGIVPLEAMLARLPVLAANTGGPVETIRDGETGWLRDPDDVEAWSGVVKDVLGMPASEVREMGENGRQRVKDLFGRDKMAATLDDILTDIKTKSAKRKSRGVSSAMATTVVGVLVLAAFVLLSGASSGWFA